MNATETISILITTYNRSHCLGELLSRLTQQFPQADAEIVVYNDASTDGTAVICAQFSPRVRSLSTDVNVGYIEGRRRLIEAATGRYLLFLDDDSCVLDRCSLDLIRQTFLANPRCGLIAANIASPAYMSGQVPLRISPFEVAEFIGCGHVLRGDIARSVGCYPQYLAGYGAEEAALTLRILDAGFSLLLVPKLRVYHAIDPAERPLVRQRASQLLNELGTVASCYPAVFVPMGLALKATSALRYNVQAGSQASLRIAAHGVLPTIRAALQDRQAVRAATLARFQLLRRRFARRRPFFRERLAGSAPWTEAATMFHGEDAGPC